MYRVLITEQIEHMEKLREKYREQLVNGEIPDNTEDANLTGNWDVKGKFVYLTGIREDLMETDYKRVFYASGGFGTDISKMGTKVFGTFIHDADSVGHRRRHQILRLATISEIDNAFKYYELYRQISEIEEVNNLLLDVLARDGMEAMRSFLRTHQALVNVEFYDDVCRKCSGQLFSVGEIVFCIDCRDMVDQLEN